MIKTIGAAAIAAGMLAGCNPTTTETTTATTPATENTTPTIPKDALDAMAALGNSSGTPSNPQMAAFSANLNKIADEVVLVKDEASARALGEKIRPYFVEMEKASKAIDAMPEAEKQAAAMSGLGPIVSAGAKIGTHLVSLPPELQKIVEAELDGMPKAPN